MKCFSKISILARYLPDPSKSSGELRFWQIIQYFQSRAETLLVFTPQRGVLPIHEDLTICRMAELERLAPGSDLAFLEFWYPGYCIPKLRRLGVPVVVDAVDVEFRRRDQEISLIGNQGDYGDNERRKEINAYKAADLVLTISEQDRKAIEGIARHTAHLPNMYLPVDEPPGLSDRRGAVFVGSYKHRPNSDGVRWYRDQVLPRLSDIEHTFVGNDAEPDIQTIPGFIGGVTSSTEYVSRARVSIAPIRYGAGLKGKTLEAFACATPIVASPAAIEGYMGAEHYPMVASGPAEFAQMVRRLNQDDDHWAKTSAQCRALAQAYRPDKVFDTLTHSLLSVVH